jgi:hypothetical protein
MRITRAFYRLDRRRAGRVPRRPQDALAPMRPKAPRFDQKGPKNP